MQDIQLLLYFISVAAGRRSLLLGVWHPMQQSDILESPEVAVERVTSKT